MISSTHKHPSTKAMSRRQLRLRAFNSDQYIAIQH